MRGDPSLRGLRLRLLQVLWSLLVICDLFVLMVSLPAFYQVLLTICTGPIATCSITGSLSTQVYRFYYLPVPLCIGIAILLYRLWDIDLIIKRTLVYGALSVSVIGVYVLVVGYVGALLRTPNNSVISLVATGVVAVLFQPLRHLLQLGVNRLLYGERDDPYAVLARLGSRLEATLLPEKVLSTIVETVAQALKLPYVAITLVAEQQQFIDRENSMTTEIVVREKQEDMIVAASGAQIADPVRVPLVYQAETMGYLLLADRTGDTFGKADSRLLTDLARQAGVAVYAVRLTAHLQRLTINCTVIYANFSFNDKVKESYFQEKHHATGTRSYNG